MLENGCIGIRIDRDDDLRGPHARQVLNGPRDATSDVEGGVDHLSSLPDLVRVGSVVRVHGCPASTRRGLGCRRERPNQGIVISALLTARPPETMRSASVRSATVVAAFS